MATTTTKAVKSGVTLSLEERLVQKYGFNYKIGEIPLSRIDINASAYNHRLTRLDQELALTYGIAMENGAEFPPIIVHQEQKLLVPDAGVHRSYGRATFTSFKTIYGIELLDLDLNDPVTLRNLEKLRIESNSQHGKAYDNAERTFWAVQWFKNGFDDLNDTATFFDVDPGSLSRAIEEDKLDSKVANYGLDPANFSSSQMKRAVTRNGLLDADRKEIERLVVTYSADSVKRKITATQVNDLANALIKAGSVSAKQVVFEDFRADMTKLQGQKVTRKSSGPQPPFKMFNASTGLIREIDRRAFVNAITSPEVAAQRQEEIRQMVLKLAGLDAEIARKFRVPAAVSVTTV